MRECGMSFHPGQKIVCINDSWTSSHWVSATPHRPKRGDTVRRMLPAGEGLPEAVWLLEIVNAPKHFFEGYHEPAFCARRFRPITERKTDISVFKKLLEPKGSRQRETA
jgi:hypothetical protein